MMNQDLSLQKYKNLQDGLFKFIYVHHVSYSW